MKKKPGREFETQRQLQVDCRGYFFRKNKSFSDCRVFMCILRNVFTKCKSVVIAVSLTAWGLNAQTLSDFIGDWTGVEYLQSPTTSYENKSISIQISQGGDRENYLIYTSSSDFIYNQNLDWAYHYVGIDKLTNQLIFLLEPLVVNNSYIIL